MLARHRRLKRKMFGVLGGGDRVSSQLTPANFLDLPVKTPSATTTLSSSSVKQKANNNQNGKVGTAPKTNDSESDDDEAAL